MEIVVNVSATMSWLVGAAFIAASYLPFAVIGTHRMECSRPPDCRGICVISRTGFLASETQPTVLRVGKLRGASMVTGTDKEGRKTQTVMLQTVDGRLPLIGRFSPNGRQSLIEEVNRFVRNSSQTKLKVDINDQSISWIVGGLFIVIGVLWALMARFGTIRLSVLDDKVAFRVRSLIGQEDNSDFPLHEFVDAGIETTRLSRGGRVSRVILLRVNAEPVPLTTFFSRYGSSESEEVAEAIRRLLKGAAEKRVWFEGSSSRSIEML